MIEIISTIVIPVLGIWIAGIEYRLRNINMRLNKAPDRDELHRTIDLKNEALIVLNRELKEDVKYLRLQMDRLIARN